MIRLLIPFYGVRRHKRLKHKTASVHFRHLIHMHKYYNFFLHQIELTLTYTHTNTNTNYAYEEIDGGHIKKRIKCSFFLAPPLSFVLTTHL